MAERAKEQLGTLLVEQRIITEDQLNEALELQKKNRKRLGNCLVQLGFADAEETARGAVLVKREYERILREGEREITRKQLCGFCASRTSRIWKCAG